MSSVPHATSDALVAVKAIVAVPASVLGAGLLLASEAPIYVGGGAIVLGLAGLFLRQFFENQAATWAIANERKRDNAELRDRIHYLQWENASLRHELARQTDPGPYIPRPKEEP